jgi:lysozyme
MDRQRAQTLIQGHEGSRNWAYADSKGILTVGIGFNLQEEAARERIEKLEVDYEALCAKRVALTNAHITSLFGEDLDTAVVDAVKLVPDFWNQPEDVQLAMVDMIFNLGGPRFSKFVGMIEALKTKDYLTAAAEMADSKWAKVDVPHRAADDIALVRGCAA